MKCLRPQMPETHEGKSSPLLSHAKSRRTSALGIHPALEQNSSKTWKFITLKVIP